MENTKISKQRTKEIAVSVWQSLARFGNTKITDTIFKLIYNQKIKAKEGQRLYYDSGNPLCSYGKIHCLDTCDFCPLNDFDGDECWCNPDSFYYKWNTSSNIKERRRYARKILKQIKAWQVKKKGELK